jgi:hypothetical protein
MGIIHGTYVETYKTAICSGMKRIPVKQKVPAVRVKPLAEAFPLGTSDCGIKTCAYIGSMTSRRWTWGGNPWGSSTPKIWRG